MVSAIRRATSLAVSELYYDCRGEINLFRNVVDHSEVAAVSEGEKDFSR